MKREDVLIGKLHSYFPDQGKSIIVTVIAITSDYRYVCEEIKTRKPHVARLDQLEIPLFPLEVKTGYTG